MAKDKLIQEAFTLASQFCKGDQAGVMWKLAKYNGLEACWLALQIAAALPSDIEGDFANRIELLALGG